jgi:hypothetical protein
MAVELTALRAFSGRSGWNEVGHLALTALGFGSGDCKVPAAALKLTRAGRLLALVILGTGKPVVVTWKENRRCH